MNKIIKVSTIAMASAVAGGITSTTVLASDEDATNELQNTTITEQSSANTQTVSETEQAVSDAYDTMNSANIAAKEAEQQYNGSITNAQSAQNAATEADKAQTEAKTDAKNATSAKNDAESELNKASDASAKSEAESAVDKAKSEYDAAKSTTEKAKKDQEQAAKANGDAKEEADAAQAKASDARSQKADADTAVNAAESVKQDAEFALTDAEANKTAAEQAESVAKANKELQEAAAQEASNGIDTNKYASAEKELDAAKTELSDATKANDEAASKVADATTAKEKANQSVTDAENEVSKAQSALDKANTDKANTDSAVTEKQNTKGAAEAELETAKSNVVDAQTSADQAKDNVTSKESELAASEANADLDSVQAAQDAYDAAIKAAYSTAHSEAEANTMLGFMEWIKATYYDSWTDAEKKNLDVAIYYFQLCQNQTFGEWGGEGTPMFSKAGEYDDVKIIDIERTDTLNAYTLEKVEDAIEYVYKVNELKQSDELLAYYARYTGQDYDQISAMPQTNFALMVSAQIQSIKDCFVHGHNKDSFGIWVDGYGYTAGHSGSYDKSANGSNWMSCQLLYNLERQYFLDYMEEKGWTFDTLTDEQFATMYEEIKSSKVTGHYTDLMRAGGDEKGWAFGATDFVTSTGYTTGDVSGILTWLDRSSDVTFSYDQLKSWLSDYKAYLAQLEASVSSAKEALDSAKSSEGYIAYLNAKSALDEAKQAYSEALSILDEANTTLEQKQQAFNDAEDALTQAIANQTAVAQSVSKATTDLEHAERQKKDSLAAQSTAQSELNEANEHLTVAQAALEKAQTALDEKQSVMDAYANYNAALVKLKELTEAYENAVTAREAADEAYAGAQDVYTNAVNDYETACKSSDEAAANVQNVSDELAAKQAVLTETERALENANDTLVNAQQAELNTKTAYDEAVKIFAFYSDENIATLKQKLADAKRVEDEAYEAYRTAEKDCYDKAVSADEAWKLVAEKYQAFETAELAAIDAKANYETLRQLYDDLLKITSDPITWTGSGTLSVVSNGNVNAFKSVIVDGSDINSNYYVVDNNSITFNEAYLKILTEGAHSVRFLYAWDADTDPYEFTIDYPDELTEAKESIAVSQQELTNDAAKMTNNEVADYSPKTGNSNNMTGYLAGLISSLCTAIFFIKRRIEILGKSE